MTVIKRKGFYIYSCQNCGVVCKNQDEPLKINGKEMCGECWYRLYDMQDDPKPQNQGSTSEGIIEK
jgi:hypothetical protein